MKKLLFYLIFGLYTIQTTFANIPPDSTERLNIHKTSVKIKEATDEVNAILAINDCSNTNIQGEKRYYDTWNFGIADVYYNPDYKDTNYSQRYGITKKTLSLDLKWGYQKIIKRFAIDFSTGLGVKYRDVQHFNRINPNDKMEATPHPNI